MTAGEGETAPSGNPLDKAADRLRESARWLLASFGAVAVVIFAGLTVADLGELDGDTPDYRLAIALVGAALSILGIVRALSRAMQLAGASTTNLEDLTRDTSEAELAAARAEVARDPALTTWGGSYDEFLADYGQAYDEYVQRAEAYATSRVRRPDASALDKARLHLQLMGRITTRVLRTVSFLRLQRAFANARRAMTGWIVVTAVGAIAFGWATSGLPEEEPSLSERPVAGTLRPTEATLKELNRQRSSDCQVKPGDDVAVVVLATNDDADELQVIALPDDSCGPTRATVSGAEVTAG